MLNVVYAYILDLILGDPRWLPHPVRIIGWAIRKFETPFRKIFRNEYVAGVLFAVVIIGFTYIITNIIILKVSGFNMGLGEVASILLIYMSIAVKDLKDEVMDVFCALKNNDIVSARKALSRIVGRDTTELNEEQIVRASVETVAENTGDGIIAPLFYAFIGGAPLAMAYKAVNTLDSMVGYKNEKYSEFGWASARIDDLFNFIPARLAAFFISLSVLICGKNFLNSVRILIRDRKKHPSPNSGIPEAVMAGALGVQVGGLSYYNGVPSEKPVIGDYMEPLRPEHIQEAMKIVFWASLITVIVCMLAVLFIERSHS